jgi:hypothetical protein
MGFWGCGYETASGQRKWLNRDPIQEQGGINLYGFVGNNPINNIDPYGLLDYYYSGGSLLQPSGPVPYLEGDTWYGNIGAGVYNTIPLAYNGLFGWISNIGTDEGTASANGDYTGLILAGVTDVAGLIPGEGEEVNLLRPYCEGKGHHIPPKSMFNGALGYDHKKALALPLDMLRKLGIDHDAISGAQNKLYNALAKTGQPPTWDAIQQIETKALVSGGANPGLAQSLVQQAIQALQKAGVSPKRIPWN